MEQRTYTVLVVEDEPMILNNLVKKINQFGQGFKVLQTARNGQQAIRVLEEYAPDILITDIRMPIMDGLQLIEQVEEHYGDIRKVILSGHDEFEYARKAMRYNVREYLLKPVDLEALKECFFRLRVELDAQFTTIRERAKALQANQGETVQETINKVRLYLNENFNQDIRLDQLAKEMNFNSSYLSKWFTKIVGENPSSYVIGLRINRAKQLLISVQELTVRQIGEMVGYTDQNYFSRIFKQFAGVSPAKYREESQISKKITTDR